MPQIISNGDDILSELPPTGRMLTDRLAFSSGRIYAASNFTQDSAVNGVLLSPLAGEMTGTEDQTENSYWLHGVGSFGAAKGYDFNEQGFVIGKDFQVSPNLVIGVDRDAGR